MIIADFLCQTFKHFEEDFPDVYDGGEFDALAGGMGLDDAGADTGYLDAWEFADEIAGFEHEVHGYHTGAPA